MTKKALGRGLQLINSILSNNSQIKEIVTIDSYYLLLEDLPDKEFIEGVVNLMRDWDNPHFIPGPGVIRKEVEKVIFGGLTKEEFILIARTYKKTGIKNKDTRTQNILDHIDFKELENNKLIFLRNTQKKLN